MNVIWKKIVSGIATLSLCMSAISVPIVQADDPTPAPGSTPTPSPTEQPVAATSERKLYLDFLGREDAPTDLSKLTAADVNKEFWVGIGVDKVDDLSLFTNGVYSVEVAIEFDKSYLAPYTSNEKTWHTALTEKNLTNTDWDPITYELWSETNADRNAIKQSDGTLIDTGADTQICTVGINVKQGQNADNARFKGLTDDSKQYLAIIPFTLLRVPGESENPYPIVLDIVRAPEALNIGAGADGKSPRSVWEISDTTPAGIENMHTLFKTNDKLSLFGSDGAISDIVPIKPKTGDETDDTRYTLFKDKPAQQSGFDPDTLTYYLSVSEDVKKLKLEIASSGEPTVTANGTLLTTSPSGGNYVSSEFELLPLNKDVSNGGEADGFNNVVTVEAGGKTYTIYIRQLLKPKIVMEYGNSPYGRIMQDASLIVSGDEAATTANQAAAKTAFDTTKMYPAPGTTQTVEYWADDYDKDEYIYFKVIQSTDSMINPQPKDIGLVEPGFTAYDSEGQEIPKTKIKRSLQIKTFTSEYFLKDGETGVTQLQPYTHTGTDTFTEISNSMNIVPGVYEMKYILLNDDNTEKEEIGKRNIAITYLMGDVNLSKAVNSSDSLYMRNHVTGTRALSDLQFYVDRICDANLSKALNSTDTLDIKNHSTNTRSLVQRYEN